MRSMSIKAKLFGGFGTVLGLLVVAVVLGVSSLGSLNQATTQVGTDSLPSVRLVKEVDASTWEYRALQYRWASSAAGDRTAANQHALVATAATTDKAFATYQALVSDSQDRALMQDANTRWKAYERATAPIVGLASAGRRAQALAVIAASDADFADFGSTLDRWTALNERGADASVKNAASTFSRGRTLLLVLALIAILVGAGIAFLVTRAITRPVSALKDRMTSLDAHTLTSLTEALEAAADGDLTHEVTAVTTAVEVRSHDELGQLSETFNAMLGKSQRSVGAYNTMRAQLADLIGEVSANACTVSAASQQMASTSDEAGKAVGEIASAVGDVAQGAERQVRMVESTRSAIQEAARAAGDSSLAAQTTADAAEQARAVAREGVQAARHATEAIQQVADSSKQVGVAIQDLSDRSERIGGIVTTITGIAEQTNLLALNAAIEAARAGEQGRGFAVVAEEVRKLAEESQAAAAQIALLIGEIQTETGKVVEVVAASTQRTDDSVGTVEQARDAFERIDNAVEEMSTRIAEIAAGVEQISGEAQRAETSITEVATVAEQSSASAEQVSASTEQTSASTQEIASSAAELARTAEQLQHLVQRFTLQPAA
jgi:methyl-accepting chemotaxis protein